MRIRKPLLLSLLFISACASAQTLQQKLQTAFGRLQQDSQCRYASVSLTVLDAKTGETIFTANPDMGLATASTMKTITAITAFNLLGRDFQYQTQLGYVGQIEPDGTLRGDVVIKGSGDPTLGSWRWATTKENVVLNTMVSALQKAGIKKISGSIVGDDSVFGSQNIPEGWIWQDVGNYYGAGTSGLCWRENQFDIKLRTGRVNAPITVLSTLPSTPYLTIKSELMNAEAGTGDRAYAFLPIANNLIYLRGTYAIDQTKKSITAALPDPAYDAAFRLDDTLKRLGISTGRPPQSVTNMITASNGNYQDIKPLITITSPALSKIIYWLDQKSVNLYAEQLIKTIAWKMGKSPSTMNGAKAVQNFWKTRGIDPNSLNTVDGSGLAPGNRVTTLTMARILQSAKKESWYTDFYESLPVYNNMKMKSGSINDVLAYTGYQNHAGQEVCFSIIVNNYSGSSSGIKQKLFKVLDELK
jgi:D-alanyl-D-alanine carboxypeptidase/D-alanyl-D-alanine-endopeptidase (penicillin-binding protein 4)